MFGFQNPFPVRLPFPIRWKGGEMKPESLQFDGDIIRVKYPKRAVTRGWWDGATVHELVWLRDVKTIDDIIADFVSMYAATRRSPKYKMKEQLRKNVRLAQADAGARVRISPEHAGRSVAGGQDSIYLVSPDGECGSIRLGTSKYQRYPLGRCTVGRPDQWPEFPELSEQPVEVAFE